MTETTSTSQKSLLSIIMCKIKKKHMSKSRVPRLCLPFLLYNHYIKYIYLIYDYITSPGSRCLMGSKQCSLWICTGLFDIGKRNVGSTSSRVKVLLFSVLPSFPPFYPFSTYTDSVSVSRLSCAYEMDRFHHFNFFVSIL